MAIRAHDLAKALLELPEGTLVDVFAEEVEYGEAMKRSFHPKLVIGRGDSNSVLFVSITPEYLKDDCADEFARRVANMDADRRPSFIHDVNL